MGGYYCTGWCFIQRCNSHITFYHTADVCTRPACVGSVQTALQHRPWSYYIDLFCLSNTRQQDQEWQHFCSQLSHISHMPRRGEVSSFCSSVHQATYQNILYGGCQADNDDADGLGGPLIRAFHFKTW